MRALALLASLSALALAGAAFAQAPNTAITAAIADPGRPAADTAHDADRHPAETLSFAHVAPGQKIGDLMMGGGYFTRLFAKAVGPKGKVYAYTPAEFIKARASYGEGLKTVSAAYPNITPSDAAFADLAFPEPLDMVFTAQNYHDMHLKPFPADTAAKTNATVFKALKPGGTYLVIDHVAAAGAADAPDKLHRIDPAVIKSEVMAAGFKFDGELAILRNPADDHSKGVFDPSLRGKTDQVVYRFKKP